MNANDHSDRVGMTALGNCLIAAMVYIRSHWRNPVRSGRCLRVSGDFMKEFRP